MTNISLVDIYTSINLIPVALRVMLLGNIGHSDLYCSTLVLVRVLLLKSSDVPYPIFPLLCAKQVR